MNCDNNPKHSQKSYKKDKKYPATIIAVYGYFLW